MSEIHIDTACKLTDNFSDEITIRQGEKNDCILFVVQFWSATQLATHKWLSHRTPILQSCEISMQLILVKVFFFFAKSKQMELMWGHLSKPLELRRQFQRAFHLVAANHLQYCAKVVRAK